MKHCNKCGKEVADTSVFCKYCGYKIKSKVTSSEKSFCHNCGKELPSHALFCKYCGTKSFEDSIKDEKESDMSESPKKEQKYFNCEYCNKKFLVEADCLRHEKNCADNPARRERKQERIIIQQIPKSGSKFLWVIILIIILGLIVFAFISNQGMVQQAVTINPCDRAYNTCVNDCGEGILSSVCKEKCTWQRNDCRSK